MARIVIDPGHGGTTNKPCSSWNNAVGPVHGALEKELTLDVATRVKAELDKRGDHIVSLTRDTDINVAGKARAHKARDINAAVFVSIHFNGSHSHNAQGTETFIHARASSTGSSAELCRAVQAAVLRVTGQTDRNRFHPPHYVKKAAFCVLNPASHASMTASVLTEVSFLDRADEEERLRRDSYLDEIAFGISNGIEDFLGSGLRLEAFALADTEVEDAVELAALEAKATVSRLPHIVPEAALDEWHGAHGGHFLPDADADDHESSDKTAMTFEDMDEIFSENAPFTDQDYIWQGLSKSQFLTRNRVRLAGEVDSVNSELAEIYGSDITRLTEQDVWVLTYIEAGIDGGTIDPDARHSNGERGLLPLPDNIDFWNGPGAPSPYETMSLETNLHNFFLYLGQLMNKPVRKTSRFMLYRDLFKWRSVSTDPDKKAQLLAGVVHGYFVSKNYRNRRVPFDKILNGFEEGRRCDDIMRDTHYIHAGKSLMTNRADNIEAALALLGALDDQLSYESMEAFGARDKISRTEINRDVTSVIRSVLGNDGANLLRTAIKALFIGRPEKWLTVSARIKSILMNTYPRLGYDDRFSGKYFSKTFGDYANGVADLIEKSLKT